MKIILVAVDETLFKAWKIFCGDLENVEVKNGSILHQECDAVVSPANSFGFMDGGIDAIYSGHFGWKIQAKLQKIIQTKHHGELIVGNAEIVETGDDKIPYLIAAPTMRVPMRLANSVNPYLAARAALNLIKHGVFIEGSDKGELIKDKVKSVAFPGLGTGVGQIGTNTCARQMRQAIDEVIFEKHQFPTSWKEAQEQHQLLYTDYTRDLQKE